jgi:hypothetical protein
MRGSSLSSTVRSLNVSDLKKSAPAPDDRARAGRYSVGPRPVVWLALLVAGVGLVVLFYAGSEHSVASTSDNATLVLQGRSLADGNVLLNHWNLSQDSFWTLDVLFNAVGYAVIGIRPALLYLVPAVVATLVVLVGVLIARDNRKTAAAGAGAIAVILVLAFPTSFMASFFLHGGLHIVTALATLLAFYAMRRGRLGWGWVVATVILAAATLGDLQAVPYGTIPMALAGLVGAARLRTWRAAAAPVSAAVASVVLAVIVRLVADAIGTFAMASINPRAPTEQMTKNAVHLFSTVANLLGVRNNAFGTGGVPDWLQTCRDATALVLAACFIVALIRLITGALLGSSARAHRSVVWWQSDESGWRLDDMLVIACFGPAAMFVGLTLSTTNFTFGRYLTASVIFVAVLAGRVVGRWYSRATLQHSLRGIRVGAGALAAAVALTTFAGTGYALAAPVPDQPVTQLMALLDEHGLTHGLGDYWSASITTVQSKGKIEIRPVAVGADNRLTPYDRESDDGWFGGTFQFVVTDATDPVGTVDGTTTRASWGRAAHIYTSGIYTVRVWSHPISFANER